MSNQEMNTFVDISKCEEIRLPCILSTRRQDYLVDPQVQFFLLEL